MSTHPLAGWYGKLPSLGDFASRRLDPDFIEAWDAWLAEGLASWQVQAPEQWLEHYLAGPSWRFVLMPGALPGPLGRSAWAGVLMPSVDRVGRYFPLTLALPLTRLPEGGAPLDALLAWLQQLDDLAVDALHEDWSVERLEEELQRLGAWSSGDAAQDLPPALALDAPLQELRPTDGVAALLAGLASRQLQAQLRGRALWLSLDGQGLPLLRLSAGLPRGDDFNALLSGAPAAAAADPTSPPAFIQPNFASPHEQ